MQFDIKNDYPSFTMEYLYVSMGCYDGDEVCELVDSHLLSKLSKVVVKKSVGFYRTIKLVFYEILQVHKQTVKGKLL